MLAKLCSCDMKTRRVGANAVDDAAQRDALLEQAPCMTAERCTMIPWQQLKSNWFLTCWKRARGERCMRGGCGIALDDCLHSSHVYPIMLAKTFRLRTAVKERNVQ